MKMIDLVSCQYVAWSSDYGTGVEDNSEEREYRNITPSRELTLGDLKRLSDDGDVSVFDIIAANSDYIDLSERVVEYNAVTEDSESIRLYVVDSWT